MKLTEINPYIRYARKHETSVPKELISAADNRIFYCISGTTTLLVNGLRYTLKKGSVICWQGGTLYCTESRSEDLDLIAFNFDYTYAHSRLNDPICPQFLKSSGVACPLEELIFDDAEKLNGCLFLENMFSVEDKFREIVAEYTNMRLFYEERCSTILKDILITIVRAAEFSQTPKNIEFAESILTYIRENYSRKITNQDIAEHFNYHPNYINRIIVNYTGMSLHRYLIQCRINAAITLLNSSEMTVSEVAAAVGMPDLKHFSKCFKNITEHCPSDYMLRR
ncbi:MAG: helix-turn-helix domain-containing protein [Clostridia bacterium]|nr:helix-turn-helix domain-containing protein [Clostridia bacterium]